MAFQEVEPRIHHLHVKLFQICFPSYYNSLLFARSWHTFSAACIQNYALPDDDFAQLKIVQNKKFICVAKLYEIKNFIFKSLHMILLTFEQTWQKIVVGTCQLKDSTYSIRKYKKKGNQFCVL